MPSRWQPKYRKTEEAAMANSWNRLLVCCALIKEEGWCHIFFQQHWCYASSSVGLTFEFRHWSASALGTEVFAHIPLVLLDHECTERSFFGTSGSVYSRLFDGVVSLGLQINFIPMNKLFDSVCSVLCQSVMNSEVCVFFLNPPVVRTFKKGYWFFLKAKCFKN